MATLEAYIEGLLGPDDLDREGELYRVLTNNGQVESVYNISRVTGDRGDRDGITLTLHLAEAVPGQSSGTLAMMELWLTVGSGYTYTSIMAVMAYLSTWCKTRQADGPSYNSPTWAFNRVNPNDHMMEYVMSWTQLVDEEDYAVPPQPVYIEDVLIHYTGDISGTETIDGTD